MKISVSLPEEDVEFVDRYLRQHHSPSRSSVIHQAIAMLREAGLENAYAGAWDEWETGGEAELWEPTAPDGVVDATR
ncbi:MULTISPECIES: ribbon-helix-helix domain-containing protein [Saccharothrix]|uniref:Antitoxin n=2 Tax=Saccharothrix TaxID=2071 RepID=A0ABU0X3K4_9PSEU|nr:MULTISPECIES: ribbon-helix-helix domain-containing protein [Saccharothrix]MBY8850730.1 ribbon-helix-helix domain-containing protein [Saccharothrix sp. MB29]MDQ2585869.1 antitoxin [Saccharothrix yanglingensis]MDR6598771.1 Arc/MetJ-type ribon-helix-helix transcriptional regulator [Saccharothrix longispora]MDU0293117.1 ribbon-helix-helix domain-containing protein [Saccharothrix longispora]